MAPNIARVTKTYSKHGINKEFVHSLAGTCIRESKIPLGSLMYTRERYYTLDLREIGSENVK